MSTAAALPSLPPRYSGATAEAGIWLATDSVTGRTVRLTPIPATALAAARRLAAVTHPHLDRVLDLVTGADGAVVVTGHSEGWSLAEAMARAPQAGAVLRASWVTAVHRAAEAVAALHRAGVVHGALAPEHLRLDAYDGVALGGLGEAAMQATTPDDALPLCASPEQLRGEVADARSDVFALGALLLYAITGRGPLKEPSGELSRRRRAIGEIDRPDASEDRAAFGTLMPVALRALRATPAERHADAGDFAAALARALVPEPEAKEGSARRWPLAVLLAAVLIAAGAGLLLRSGRLPGIWTPVAELADGQPGWQSAWIIGDGRWHAQREALVTADETVATLFLRRRLVGDVAIEFTASCAADAAIGDLAAVWSETDPANGRLIYDRHAYIAQAGAWDNLFAGIQQCPLGAISGLTDYRLERGRDYRCRLEVVDDELRWSVDGRLVATHRASMPFQGGWIGILGYYPGKRFSDIRVWTRGSGASGPLAVADAFLRHEHTLEAAELYAQARSADPSVDQPARYREGLALRLAGRHEQARQVWQGLESAPWRELARCHQLQGWIERADHPGIVAGLRALGPQADPRVRDAQRRVWQLATAALPQPPPPDLVEDYLAVRRAVLGTDVGSASAAGNLLMRCGRYAEAAAMDEGDDRVPAAALVAMGRDEEALARFGHVPQAARQALISLGRFDVIAAEHRQSPWAVRETVLLTGRDDIAPAPFTTFEYTRLRIARGEVEATLADPTTANAHRVAALLALDRLDEAAALARSRKDTTFVRLLREGAAAALADPEPTERLSRFLLWCRLLEDPPAAERSELLARLRGGLNSRVWRELWFAETVVAALVDAQTVDAQRTALERLAEAPSPGYAGLGQRFAAYALGRLDREAWLAQPARRVAQALLPVAEGLRRELAGDTAGAIASYREYLDLPPWRRCLCEEYFRDLLPELFVRQRLARLAGG